MKPRLATINLQVPDPDRSRKFYEDVLGMVEDPRRSHPPGFVYLRSEGCDLTIAAPHGPGDVAPPGSASVELGFEVETIGPMREHLSALGIPDFREESMGWGEAIELNDPDGHRIVIYAFPKRV